MVLLVRHLPQVAALLTSGRFGHFPTHQATSSLHKSAAARLPAKSLLASSHASSAWNLAHYKDLILYSSNYNYWQIEPREQKPFLESPRFLHMVLFLATLEVFICMHIFILLKFPAKKRHPGPGLMLTLWVSIAAAYNALIYYQNKQEGLMWNAGYFLELMSLVENVFVFHVITHSFQVPRALVRKALFIVACLQILFQAVLFLGFADVLRKVSSFQYILGMWLVVCAYLAMQASGSGSQDQVLFKDWYSYRIVQVPLGGNLSESYEGDSCFFLDKGARHYRCSLLLPVILFLSIAGLSLEVDGILLKIEEIDSNFLSFTSSAIATLIMPEVFLLAQDLFCKFSSLKYGIAFALAFFGAQLLLHDFLVIPTILSCAVVFAVLLCCILTSLLCSNRPKEHGPDPRAES